MLPSGTGQSVRASGLPPRYIASHQVTSGSSESEKSDRINSLLLGAHVWVADTGELAERLDLGRCGGIVAAASTSHLVARTLHGSADVLHECRWADGTIGAELVDRSTGERELLSSDVGGWLWGAAMSGDGRYVAVDDAASRQVVVLDVIRGEQVTAFEGAGVRDLNNDGSLVLLGDSPIEVRNVATGEVNASFHGHSGESLFARFGPSGRTVYSTGADGALREWDTVTGRELLAYPNVGNGRPSFAEPGLVLVAQPDRDTATLLDTRPRGEIGAIETCTGAALADSLRVIDEIAIVHAACGDDPSATTHVVDLGNGEVSLRLPGHQAQALAISPDGDRFVRQEGDGTMHGPLVVRDTRSGELAVTLDGLCAWDEALSVPPEQQAGCRSFPDEPFAVWA